MRKPRDFDAELKALDDKAKLLKTRKLQQLGELVIATGADILPIERLAGALLLAVDERSEPTKEAQRARGAVFFQRAPNVGGGPRSHRGGAQAGELGAPPPASPTGAR